MDFLNSFFQNVKDKLTSPFFGTLSFILLVHHWEFWYTLFNFDAGSTLIEKLNILRMVSNREFAFKRILFDIASTIFIMLVGYAIVLATRSLSLLIDFRTMPWITGRIISKNVVERKVHEEIIKERDGYAEKYEEQRQFVRKYSKEYDEQVEQVQAKNVQVSKLNEDVSTINNRVNELNNNLSMRNSELESLRNETKNKENTIESLNIQLAAWEGRYSVLQKDLSQFNTLFHSDENALFYNTINNFPPSIVKLVGSLKQDEKWEIFKHVAIFERHGGTISPEYYPMMEPYGIIIPNTEVLTSLGKILTRYYRIFDNE
jgi:archaellum component FlaC